MPGCGVRRRRAPGDNAQLRQALLRRRQQLHGVAAGHLHQRRRVDVHQHVVQVRGPAPAQHLPRMPN